jgi:ATP-binding cassette subfamily B multidrug efflux pump
MNAHQVIVMDQGTIVARGTHQELMASDPLYKELYQSWATEDSKNR